MIEVKWKNAAPVPQLGRFFAEEPLQRVQVVGKLAQSKSFENGLRIEPAVEFLAGLDFSSFSADC